MKCIKHLWFIAMLLCYGVLSAQPTDNPVASYYNSDTGYPAWTDNINWSNVIDMSSYSNGSDNFEKFENARDELYSQGGGVLYYPSGTYDFTVPNGPNGRGLMLKPGVVIRGQAPSSNTQAVISYSSHGLSSMPTVFNLNTTDGNGHPSVQNFIGCTPATASKVGIAWVNVNKGYVHFGFNATQWAGSYGTAEDWLTDRVVSDWQSRVPDGTFLMDAWAGDGTTGNYNSGDVMYGSNRLVFGCRLDNAFIPNYVINVANCSSFDMDEESFRYGGVVSVYGNHVFVANNVLSEQSTQMRNFRLGIDVNKNLLAFYQNRCDVSNEAGYYGKDVMIIDNWIYNRGSKSIEASGTNMVIRDNMLSKDYVSGTPTYQSCRTGSGSTDYMNRGIDVGGKDVWIENNEVRNTGSGGNDGEGFLVQRHNEVELFSHAYTNNHAESAEGGNKGYIAPYDAHVMGMLTYNNYTSGDVGILKLESNVTSDIAVVQNTADNGVTGSSANDFEGSCPSGTPNAPDNVSVTAEGTGYRINWDNNSNNEIGFKVQRKIGSSGNAYTIAYRPRHSQGSTNLSYNPDGSGGGGPCDCATPTGYDFNEQGWTDYSAPTNQQVYYRIVAINCSDDGGASPWVEAQSGTSNEAPDVMLNTPSDGATFTEGDVVTLSATASDTDGSISTVEFYVGGGKVGEDTSSPYDFSWSSNTTGNLIVYARAIDDDDASTNSASVTITVDPASTPSERSNFLPGSTYMSDYDTRVNDFLNLQTWDYVATNHGGQDNGKRFWPQFLAELEKGNASISELESNGWGVYNQYEGSVYKPFSASGLLYYYYNFANSDHQSRITGHYEGSVYGTVNGESGGGRAFASRPDGEMDPIYNCTEFNSENFNWLNRIFGYMMSHQTGDNQTIDGVNAQSWFDDYLQNLTRATFSTGRVEWNSQNYTGFCVQAIEPVYQFATWDSEDQERAAAILDWMALETALHAVDGTYVGPKSRGKGLGIQAQHGSIAPYYYLWFGQGEASSFSDSEGTWTSGLAAQMQYRPLDVIVDIANRNFNMPVEVQSAKPFYHADNNNYAAWEGTQNDSRRFEFETLWIDEHYTMSSIATNRPRGENTFSEQELWGIAVEQSNGYALQVFGNANNNNDFGANHSEIHRDIVGRSPHQEIGQYRNTMMQLIKNGSNQYIYAPSSKNPSFDGERMFVDMGNGVYIAVTPYNHTGKTSESKTSDDGILYDRFQWNFSADLGALIIETGTSAQHGSFTNFVSAIKNNTTVSSPATDQVEYVSTQASTIKMEWVSTSTYTYLHNDCNNITVDPAGVVSKVWGDGNLIDFDTWDSYNVSYGDDIVDQDWGSGILKMAASGQGVEIAVNKTNAEVGYSAFTPGTGDVSVTGVSVSPSSSSVAVGQTEQLTATVSPSDATDKAVSWSSSNTSVATVDGSGLVTAVAEGSATITATTNDGGFTDTSSITVTSSGDGDGTITVRAKMISGDSDNLELRIDDNTVHTWTISGSSYADYTYSGLSDAGNVKLYFQDNGTDMEVDYIIAGGSTYQSEDQSVNTSVWQNSSCGGSNSEIMHCSGYIDYGTIDFSSGSVSVTGVSVSPTSVSIEAGQTAHLTETVTPSDASDPSVAWSSSNTAVATVDVNGLVTAVAEGTVTVTVTTNDGGYTATSEITVSAATCVEENVAIGRSVIDRSGEQSGNEAEGLIDGDASTRWSVDGLPTAQYVEIDLGQVYDLTRTELITYNERAYQYTIEAKQSSGDAYTMLVDRSSNTEGGSESTPITDEFTAFSARYVLLTVTGAANYTGSWCSLEELSIYNTCTDSNQSPTVSITSPVDNATFSEGDDITIQADASDDNSIALVEFFEGNTKLGEDNASPYEYSWSNVSAGSYSLTAVATDDQGLSATSAVVNIEVQTASSYYPIPGTIEAENYSAMSGVQTETTSDTGGGENVGWIDAGDWMDYEVDVAAAGSYTFEYRVASQNGGGAFELQNGSTTYHSETVPSTGDWQNWTTISTTATLDAGQQTLRIYATSGGFNINWFSATEDGGSTGDFNAMVNFQPSGYSTPTGFVADEGAAYGDRGNGYVYGWDQANGETRDRNVSGISPERNTLNHMDNGSLRTWEIEVPNGDYMISLVAGDASYSDQVNDLEIEGTSVNDPDGQDNFDEYTDIAVTVNDGRLTIAPATSADNPKICYVSINSVNSSSRMGITQNELRNEAKQHDQIVVYPNPVSNGELNIDMPVNNAVYKIYNMQGKVMLDGNIRSGESINVDRLPKGIYNIMLNTQNQSSVHKIIIR